MNLSMFASGPKSGLSNNGGSKTIIKSSEALRKLGHDVEIVANYNGYTWDKFPAPVDRISPKADVVIAVSCNDVKNALKEANGRPVYWWMRGLETWKMSEEKIIQRAKSVKMLVNATHLKDWLAERGVESTVVYSGADNWKDKRSTYNFDDPVVGILYLDRYNAKTKNYKFAREVVQRSHLRFVELNKPPFTNCSQPTLQRMYNACDIWLSTSESEGFHQVPFEAAHCGCLIFAPDYPHSGTQDYATEETAHIYSSLGGCLEQLKKPDFSKVEKMRKRLKQIGTREECMKRLIEVISE